MAAAIPKDLEEAVASFGQEHVFGAWGTLSDSERMRLLTDVRDVDFPAMKHMFESAMQFTDAQAGAAAYAPPTRIVWADSAEKPAAAEDRCILTRLDDVPVARSESWRNRGLHLLGEGKVAAVMLAGGQGTRLGWSEPKGTYPIGAVSKHSLYQILAERVAKVHGLTSERHPNAPVPFLCIMTADHNNDATIDFFQRHNFFNLLKDRVRFFQQQMVPSFTFEGKFIMDQPFSLARSPNGNGPVFRSMEKCGLLQELRAAGVEYLHVFGVDNALMKVLDPTFLGYVQSTNSDVGNKCAYKTDPGEKVGVMCTRLGVPCVVEYSDLPADMRDARAPDGNLQFCAGNICNHVFRMDFVQNLLDTKLFESAHPNVARKKIPYCDPAAGWKRIIPEKENGVKIEYFIFDCFSAAQRVAGLEVPRADDFAPVKNALGPDSPDTVRAAMTALYRRWLTEKLGLKVAPGDVEISPLVSYEGEGLGRWLGAVAGDTVRTDRVVPAGTFIQPQ